MTPPLLAKLDALMALHAKVPPIDGTSFGSVARTSAITIRLDIAEDGSVRLIAVDPDDDCTITVLVDKRTNKRMPT